MTHTLPVKQKNLLLKDDNTLWLFEPVETPSTKKPILSETLSPSLGACFELFSGEEAAMFIYGVKTKRVNITCGTFSATTKCANSIYEHSSTVIYNIPARDLPDIAGANIENFIGIIQFQKGNVKKVYQCQNSILPDAIEHNKIWKPVPDFIHLLPILLQGGNCCVTYNDENIEFAASSTYAAALCSSGDVVEPYGRLFINSRNLLAAMYIDSFHSYAIDDKTLFLKGENWECSISTDPNLQAGDPTALIGLCQSYGNCSQVSLTQSIPHSIPGRLPANLIINPSGSHGTLSIRKQQMPLKVENYSGKTLRISLPSLQLVSPLLDKGIVSVYWKDNLHPIGFQRDFAWSWIMPDL